ncbi:recombinase family protein [Eubacteriales bacterium OttesenSCG-928-G02]|nr:recombinase family protein [Eubacteriales bacterium OttesenSCG-928-G02]
MMVENTHEPIIDRDYFYEVQRIMREAAEGAISKRTFTAPYTDSVLKGKVICAHCGYSMHRHRSTSKNFVTYWFNCQTQTKISKQACVQVSVKEEELKSTILNYLQKKAKVFIGRYINIQNKILPAQTVKIDTELRAIRQEQDKNKSYLKSLYESLVSDLITADEYREMKTDYESKIEEQYARADELRNRKRHLESQVTVYRNLAEAVRGICCNDDLTSELIGKTVERIEISRDKSIMIRWKFDDDVYRSGD